MNAREYSADVKERKSFLRSVGVLVTGTAFAHAITAIATPILSRLYSPADFSALAVFSALLSIISVAACLRFDIAVTLPDNDSDALNILALALNSALFVSVLIAIPSLLMPESIATRLNQPVLQPYLWLLPPSVLFASCYNALQAWFVRNKRFSLIALTRIGQSVGGTGTQVGLGLGGVAPLGLLLGYIMNNGAACIVLGLNLLKSNNRVAQTISFPRMRTMAYTHCRFPKYSTLEAISNSAAIQLPIIIIAALAVGPEAGYLTMAMYVMQAPVALVGTAVGQVYLSRAPDEHRAGQLGQFTSNTFGRLLKAGVGPLLFAGIVSPIIFPIVFGGAWARAGRLVGWMTPWFVMQFIAYPISMALHVTGNQRTALMLQIFALLTRVGTVWVVGAIAVEWITESYAISGFLIYLVYVGVVFHRVPDRSRKLTRYFKQTLPHIFVWVLLGLAARIVSFLILKPSL
jgi:O-antigen/teichoic acid export membrane protein